MMLAKITLNSLARNPPGGLVQGLTPQNSLVNEQQKTSDTSPMQTMPVVTIQIEIQRNNAMRSLRDYCDRSSTYELSNCGFPGKRRVTRLGA
jgi:hypothetical protein